MCFFVLEVFFLRNFLSNNIFTVFCFFCKMLFYKCGRDYYICAEFLLNIEKLVLTFARFYIYKSMKKIIILVCMATTVLYFNTSAQSRVNKDKKSRYFKNNTQVETEDGFMIDGFERNYDKREERENVPAKTKDPVYKVNVRSTEKVGKYDDERKIETVKTITTAPVKDKKRKAKKEHKQQEENVKPTVISKERVIYMTGDERDYATTVVRKRYTSLDILADDLDISKYQRPVFKGICQECDADADNIITNKNLSSLEKNYQLKQSYMLRDKRLRETLDTQQYKKWHRIKDEDEYLILTADPELIDGVYK